MKLISACFLVAVLLSGAAGCGAESGSAVNLQTSSSCYLFSYFTGNGESGLHLAQSTDGFSWSPLAQGRSFLQTLPGALMRDPFLMREPDGTFHLAYSSCWTTRTIGIAHSRDLVHWSGHRLLPVMEYESDAANTWAPEILYDDANSRFMIYWSSTIPGRFPATDQSGDAIGPSHPDKTYNHRIYACTTKDFETFTTPTVLFDGGFNVIDADIVRDGSRWVMFVKDETLKPEPVKRIRVTTATVAGGPYGKASEPITEAWTEGPSALRVGNKWFMYFDNYTRGRYGLITSEDLVHWTDESDRLKMPEGVRHGAALPVPCALLQKVGTATTF